VKPPPIPDPARVAAALRATAAAEVLPRFGRLAPPPTSPKSARAKP